MNLVLLGPPGSGKGTQAARVASALDVPQISTGDILREAVRLDTALGRHAKELMDRGELVPDNIIEGIVRDRLRMPDAKRGFILDGFPRTRGQAEMLQQLLVASGRQLDRVINVTVPEDELVTRMSGRRSCPECGRVYHALNNPPQQEGQCDACGADLVQRLDDREEVVRDRQRIYVEKTAPLIAYYRSLGNLMDVDGARPIDAVFDEIQKALGWARA